MVRPPVTPGIGAQEPPAGWPSRARRESRPDRPAADRGSAHRLVACLAAFCVLPLAGTALAQTPSSPAGPATGTGTTQSGPATGAGITNPLGAAPSVQPQIGSLVPPASSLEPNYSSNGLHDQIVQSVLQNGTAQQPGLVFQPSIAVTQEYDTGGQGSAFVTSIQPALTVTDNTERVQANVNYSPVVRLFEGGSETNDPSNVAQNFNGRVLGTILPQTLFLDMRGFAAEQARFGGLGSANTTTLDSNDATQNYSFSISPYLLHRFGTFGTGEFGYSFARTIQQSTTLDANDTSGNATLAQALNQIGNQNVTTQNLHLAFTTGEYFGRYNGAWLASATYFDGTGVLSDAHRNIISLDNGYAVTRTVTLLGRIGYEDIQYSGTSPLHIEDALWNVGIQLAPSPTAQLTVRYGHLDGFNSFQVNGSVSPTARTRVFAQYSAGLSTQQEDLQNALANSSLDALGNPVDYTTGVPIYLVDNAAGDQAGLYKLRRASIGAQLLLDRDVFTIAINRDDSTLISSSSALAASLGLAASTTSTTGSITWQHELTPRLSTIAFFEYGKNSGGQFSALSGSSDTDTLIGSLSANYLLGPGLTATALYSYSRDYIANTVLSNSSSAENRFLIGLRKAF